MFRAHSAHHQEVHDANCTYAASGIVSVTYREQSFLSGCTRQSLTENSPSLAVAQDKIRIFINFNYTF
jgi:hypothetical protein